MSFSRTALRLIHSTFGTIPVPPCAVLSGPELKPAGLDFRSTAYRHADYDRIFQ